VNAPALRVGIAGLGRMGRRHALNLAQRTPGAQLVAACGPTVDEREWARRELGVGALYEDFGAMLRDAAIDAVAIVSPTTLHAEQTIAALEAGKHVFLEKPLALDVARCEQVAAVARRHPQQVALVGFVRRFDASYRQARADIEAGVIGRPFLVVSRSADMNDPGGFFVRFAPTSGGIMLDVMVHDVDATRWLLGRPKALRVFASGTIALHPGLAECGDVDNAVAIVEFEGGVRAQFHATRTLAHHDVTTEIIGTEGMLAVGAGSRRDRVQIHDAHGVRHRPFSDFLERFSDAFEHEMAAFVAACRGDVSDGLPTLADATEATRIGVALARSLKSGQVESVE
jgi:myo-inositol 2-dehydrogenase/D-chiro-inositol 1-dehydrogenase